jgi:hypothetical protein
MSPEHNHFDNGHFDNGIADEELNDTDRMVALIEAATTKFDATDPGAVETLFAAQALALDVIFKDFVRRRTYTFDNMRVALKAQAQCRMTFKSLVDFKHPRRPVSTRISRNSSEQTIETAKSSE